MHRYPYPPMVPLMVLCLCLFGTSAMAQETPPPSAETVFFEGLDLKEAGNCTDAIPLFQQALSLDAGLHQARLYLAECAHWDGQDELAVEQLQAYLGIEFAEAEHDRAQALLETCQASLAASPPAVEVVPDPEPTQAPPDGDGYDTSTAYKSPASGRIRSRSASGWSAVRVGTGVALAHYANDAKLTTAGPLLAGHLLVARYLEFTVLGQVAFGPYQELGGSVTVPQFGFGAAASIPLGKPRLGVGIVIPLVFSRYDDRTLADGGILGELALRVPVAGTRLVIGGQFQGGYLVRPVVGGSLRFEIQLGPLGEDS